MPVSTHLSWARKALKDIEDRLAGLDQYLEQLENVGLQSEISTPASMLSGGISAILSVNVGELKDFRKWLGQIQEQAYREETSRKGAHA